MKKFAPLFQFLPLSIFLAVAKSYEFSEEGWTLAFEGGGFAAVLEFAILIPLLGNRLNRLIAGANLFLIIGGIAFFGQIISILNFMGLLMEATLILCVGLVCLIAVAATETGVFEEKYSTSGHEKRYSIYFLIGVAAAFGWAMYWRNQTLLAGTVPFVFLIFLKQLLQAKLVKLHLSRDR